MLYIINTMSVCCWKKCLVPSRRHFCRRLKRITTQGQRNRAKTAREKCFRHIQSTSVIVSGVVVEYRTRNSHPLHCKQS